jgi:hypothetical protein
VDPQLKFTSGLVTSPNRILRWVHSPHFAVVCGTDIDPPKLRAAEYLGTPVPLLHVARFAR